MGRNGSGSADKARLLNGSEFLINGDANADKLIGALNGMTATGPIPGLCRTSGLCSTSGMPSRFLSKPVTE
jgi:hypothetical protein